MTDLGKINILVLGTRARICSPMRGFLSHLHWTLVDAGGSDPDAEDPCPTVVLEAESTRETYAVWPYHFRAVYTVTGPFIGLIEAH